MTFEVHLTSFGMVHSTLLYGRCVHVSIFHRFRDIAICIWNRSLRCHLQ